MFLTPGIFIPLFKHHTWVTDGTIPPILYRHLVSVFDGTAKVGEGKPKANVKVGVKAFGTLLLVISKGHPKRIVNSGGGLPPMNAEPDVRGSF